ncbi:PREDICTED: uncharacterized protein LOC108752098 [Trachymyrmex septentrionalis]|uniref:uncharacterized protein LOC108752098 n=1 Tax=Trachymyrmex septentrionalis TaxID=34720 RepID=UPI00084F3CE8|nr:PREDICTED: uncharacterized protein LOC108752098 [Trachymyrmex septentrionalis]
MSNLRDLVEIQYEYPVEGVSRFMVDNEPQIRLQLQNEIEVQIIPSVRFINIANKQMVRAESRWDRDEQIDIWETLSFNELFVLRPYEPDPEPEDWNCKFNKILFIKI